MARLSFLLSSAPLLLLLVLLSSPAADARRFHRRSPSSSCSNQAAAAGAQAQGGAQQPSSSSNKPAVQGAWADSWTWSKEPAPAPAPSHSSSSAHPAPAQPSPSSTNSNAATGTTGDVQSQSLDSHNSFRQQYQVGALSWNQTLADAASQWASKCVFQHSNGALGPYGENLASGTGSYSATDGIKQWTDESSKYDYSNPGFSEAAGHFTQVVWKATEQVGCALISCAPGTLFSSSYGNAGYLVCEYAPAGNVEGEFPQNVLPKA